MRQVQPRTWLQNEMPEQEDRGEERQEQGCDTPPTPTHGRHGLEACPVDVFSEGGEVGFDFVETTGLGDTTEPVLIIEAEVLAVAADDAFADHAAGELVEKVGLERLQVAHENARDPGHVLQPYPSPFTLLAQLPANPDLIFSGNLHGLCLPGMTP